MTDERQSSNPNAIENLTPEELEDRIATFGPLYRFSDHKPGETIRFRRGGQLVTGEIIWVTGPGDLPASGKHTPVSYFVGVGTEMSFSVVYPSEVIQ